MSFTFFNLGGGGAAAETVDGVAGEAIALGAVCYLSAGALTTAGKIYLADADDAWTSTTAAVLGICTSAAAADGDAVTIQTSGLVDGSGLTGLTAGKCFGLSGTPGALALTASAPWIGVAESATSLRLSGVYTTSGLTAGTAYGSNASGVLTSGLSESVGYAVSATELQMRPRFGATDPAESTFSPLPTYFWRCDGASSGAVTSAAATYGGIAAAVNGGTGASEAIPAAGSARNVLEIDGASNSGLSITGVTGGIGSATFTVQMWFKLVSTPSSLDRIFELNGAGGAFLNMLNWNTSGPKPQYYAGGAYDVSPTAISTGTWYHHVVTIDGTSGVFYTSTGTTFDVTGGSAFTCGSNAPTSTSIYFLGGAGTAGVSPEMTLADVAIWSGTALSAAQVQTLFNGGVPLGM